MSVIWEVYSLIPYELSPSKALQSRGRDQTKSSTNVVLVNNMCIM